MNKFKNLRSILLTTGLTVGMSLFISNNTFAATYTTVSGDSLYKISQLFNTTPTNLMEDNSLKNTNLSIGQVLHIPDKISTVQATSVTPVVMPIKSITNSVSASDVDLLSRLITAEAQGEEYDAKVAVGSVVMNRVKSTEFPNSISEVINQNVNGHYQFTPVLNGSINNPADADSIKAAKAALSGIDTTKGALFYFDDSTTNTWLLSQPISSTIDSLIFAF